ncbi:MAG: 30S ribosomal protein S12 methylthiotransferase RimO [Anaerolineae bacterium]|nr:30S ribosomal protein S12 methylthiotransferase RimO [Anaerolineae bacterium]
MKSFFLISLGCPKNLVDSEGMATLLRRAGYQSATTPEEADLLIVNTCGFIESAREESRAVLQEVAEFKGPNQRIVAAGCYSQRCPHELAADVPGIDGLIGTRRWMDILDLVERLEERQELVQAATSCGERSQTGETPPSQPIYHIPETPTVGQDTQGVVRAAPQGNSAYLKLADGCRRSCAFCAIPLIKGSAVSRPPEAILADARRLADLGLREIILIAQDTTDYGHDLGMEEGLAQLLEELVAEVPDVPWIRLMYAYPGRITERLIATMARYPQVLPYVDLPLQHADPDVLRRMRRPANVKRVRGTIAKLREAMPEIAIRTTFLVGYPGETEEAFRSLLDFVEEMRFDRVGVFTYSQEEGTPAAELDDNVPLEVKERRREQLMAVQQPISLEKNEALVGETLDVLIEGQDQGLSVGRSYRDAPEVDGLVLIQHELPVGDILPVRIVAALEYDLIAEPVSTLKSR